VVAVEQRPPGEAPPSPYRGLRPYTEAEAAFFFGREAEGEIVAANLLGARLTLLYGPSGVGKSSVLLAGVVSGLRERSRENLADDDAAGFAVVVVRTWADADSLQTVRAAVRAEAAALLGRDDLPDPPADATLADVLAHWSDQVGGKLLILFDQFEEYFVYHDRSSGPGTFDVEFPHAVNRPDLRANFLLSIRDDSLARLDRFKGRIPGLFDNRLQIDHLTLAAARDAVTLPIAEYNRRVPPGQRVEIEDGLVTDVLDQVRRGRVSLGSMGAGGVQEKPDEEAHVETPILQVVMTALWEKEAELGSRVLRAKTLANLGGAEQLVRDRLDERMARLSRSEQDAAADVARFLVTPSGAKIAWTSEDLIAFAYPDPHLAEWSRPHVESALETLSQGDARVLRPVAPLGGQGATRYEIFHDILGPAILDWRTRYIKNGELAEAVGNSVTSVVLGVTTFWWLFWTIFVAVAGFVDEPLDFLFLIWTLSALFVLVGWWRVLRRRRGRRQHLRLLVALVLGELAVFTAPLSFVVIVPVLMVRRRRRRKAVRPTPVPAAAAGGS
jgi:hypothetical protein